MWDGVTWLALVLEEQRLLGGSLGFVLNYITEIMTLFIPFSL